jgi:hypothetical protein
MELSSTKRTERLFFCHAFQNGGRHGVPRRAQAFCETKTAVIGNPIRGTLCKFYVTPRLYQRMSNRVMHEI